VRVCVCAHVCICVCVCMCVCMHVCQSLSPLLSLSRSLSLSFSIYLPLFFSRFPSPASSLSRRKLVKLIFFHINDTCAPVIKKLFALASSHIEDTGWRRLIGSPELQIIFHKRATKYRSLLRKMTYKDKGSYESSPPCTCTSRK